MGENVSSSPNVTGAPGNAWSSSQPLARTRKRPAQRIYLPTPPTTTTRTLVFSLLFSLSSKIWCYPSIHPSVSFTTVTSSGDCKHGVDSGQKNESKMNRNGFAACPEVIRSVERTGLGKTMIFFFPWTVDFSGVSDLINKVDQGHLATAETRPRSARSWRPKFQEGRSAPSSWWSSTGVRFQRKKRTVEAQYHCGWR